MFWLLHVAAILFYPAALFATIPLHVIAGILAQRVPSERPTPATHVHCPDCRELVRKDARICKHCRCALTPQP